MRMVWLFGAGTAALFGISAFLWEASAPALRGAARPSEAPANRNSPPPVATPEAAATIVVYNTNDRDSDDLARFYAARRGIPKERVVGLKCAVTEDITRDEYDRTIAEPLRDLFTKNGWWKLRAADHPLGRVEQNSIRFIALIRGIPLKIAAFANYPGDKPIGPPELATHNEAAVDSELVTLGTFSRVISGARNNEYYRSYARVLDFPRPDLMLVARLDGPTPEIVKRMIADAVATEQEGLRGFAYIDARAIQQAGYKDGDSWLYGAADACRQHGVPVILDNGEGLYPDAYPMRYPALYYGWYTGNAAGPFVLRDFHLTRGAVAIHIHSFSAATLRSVTSNWCGPLLAAGATATFGNVYEPYLAFTPQIDIFNERLLDGFTFAESAWMASRVTSWQTTVIGDPLYRPFNFINDVSAKTGATEWDAYREASGLWYRKDHASGEAALRAAAKRFKSGVIWEGLGLLELTLPDARLEALAAFREARKAYKAPDDIVRAGIHEIILLKGMNRHGEALSLVDTLTRTYRRTRAIEVLRMLQ
jgi:uncharacterized protein (TIGR03790 family)